MFTMQEHFHHGDRRISFAYVGDASNNVANSLLIAGAMTGMDVRMVAPPARRNSPQVVAEAHRIAADTDARITQAEDPVSGVEGVDFVYTDVWVSMGEPVETWHDRIELLLPYQVNRRLLEATGNPEVKFMHCLPAFHNRETTVADQLYAESGLEALEVTDDVFESSCSIVFDQAENRMHAIKAIMVATLGG
jgi:ornithine carbamoyltransferase